MPVHKLDPEQLLYQLLAVQDQPFAVADVLGRVLLENEAYTRLHNDHNALTAETTTGLLRTPIRDSHGNLMAFRLMPRSVVLPDSHPSQASTHHSQHVDQFSILNELMADMLSYQNLDPLLQRIADIVVDITDATNALILLVDETEEFLDVVASAGASSAQNMGERRRYGEGFAGLAWSTKKNQYLANSDLLSVTKGFWPPASQLVAVPLMSDDTVIGVGVLSSPADSENFRTSTGIVRHLASLAGIAIVNARAKETSQLEISRMRVLRDIGSALETFESALDLIQSVSKTLMNAMDICRVVYFFVENDGETEHSDIWVKKEGAIEKGESITSDILNEGVNGWCYRHGESAYLPRNFKDPRESQQVHEQREKSNIGSTLCVPIFNTQGVFAVISISRDLRKRDLSENERFLFVSICGQITAAIRNRELSEALTHRAFHDGLTGLPNRSYFEKELEQQLHTGPAAQSGAVLFIDLDGFKSVNDSLGHHFGDKLLKRVARRFSECLGHDDVIARIGGDEFAILARSSSDSKQLLGLAQRLIDSLDVNVDIDGAQVNVGASVGLSLYPQDGMDTATLLRNADEAMYRAKASRKGCVVVFDQGMADESRRRVQIETQLKDALEKDQFRLLYQPQVDSVTGRVGSVEALIRWEHPDEGLLSPAEFVPVAEEAGLINVMGTWVLEEAVAQLVRWKKGPLANLRIAVNIASSQFLQKGFSHHVLSLLERERVSPAMLEIEVTESIVMKDIDVVVAALDTLRSSGIRVAVDDFGTGYSSLSYLQDLPLDILKIDRAFIRHLDSRDINKSVANTIMLLAKGMNLETVAEGVETEAQLRLVRELGCTLIQGFLFSKPCSAEELCAVVSTIHDRFDYPHLRQAS